MSRWSDLAAWRGPSPNHGGAMAEVRGLVLHIAEGYYEGTIGYQLNRANSVSSHFIVGDGAKGQGRDGDIAQLVDTDVVAWTQSAGNGHWLSSENAGFTPNGLTAAQVEANARLFARGHLEYGYPLQLATTPNSYGLGHHSMGCNWPGGAWGHCDCPGDTIIAQKAQILSRAIDLAGGDMLTPYHENAILYDNNRLEALISGRDKVAGTSSAQQGAGQEVWMVKAIKQLAADVAALKTGGVDIAALVEALKPSVKAMLLDPAVLRAIAKAVTDEIGS